MSLEVDLQKKLAEFSLDIRFSCGAEIISILGASGAGKSMLLKSIAGLVRPDEGRVVLNGRTIYDSAAKVFATPQQRRIGFLFQNYALFPHLTVAQNIAFGLGRLDKEARRRVMEMLEKFHIVELKDRYPPQISGGQQQRVALARTMAVDPEILLLDEPFSAVDVYLKNQLQKEMFDFLKQFSGPALFVTHDIDEAYRLSDRILVLHRGKVEAMEDKANLFRRPPTLAGARITGCRNLAAYTRLNEYEIEVEDWGNIRLHSEQAVPLERGFVGIRSHHLYQIETADQVNGFPVWIADTSDAPFRMTFYLKIGAPPASPEDYHLCWEVARPRRQAILDRTPPFYVQLDPAALFYMND